MSPIFIAKFKKETGCCNCKASTKEGYSCCNKHLKAAKLRFRKWSATRRKQKRCCYCDCKSYKGWLRCKKHTKENRERMQLWMLNHPNHSKELLEKRKQISESGRCWRCPQHRKLYGKYKMCLTCRQSLRLWEAGVKTDKNTPVAKVRAMFAKLVKAKKNGQNL